MKRKLLAVPFLALGLSLSACSTNFVDSTHDLTVTVSGVTTASVQIYDVTKSTNIYQVDVTGSKTFSALPAGHTYRVTGGAVAGYNVSAAQDVTLNSSQSVTVTYTPQ